MKLVLIAEARKAGTNVVGVKMAACVDGGRVSCTHTRVTAGPALDAASTAHTCTMTLPSLEPEAQKTPAQTVESSLVRKHKNVCTA